MKFTSEARLIDLEPIYDGDTFTMFTRPWIDERRRIEVRLLGVDTAEKYGDKREVAQEQTEFVKNWFRRAQEYPVRFPLVVETEEQDSFGRVIATVQRKLDGADLSEAILKEFGNEYTYED